MKTFALFFLATISFNSANASTCFDVVQKSYKDLLAENGYRFDGFDVISKTDAVLKIKESTEVEDTKAALRAVKGKGTVLFVGYSSIFGGSGEEILVVDGGTCKVIEKIYTYVE